MYSTSILITTSFARVSDLRSIYISILECDNCFSIPSYHLMFQYIDKSYSICICTKVVLFAFVALVQYSLSVYGRSQIVHVLILRSLSVSAGTATAAAPTTSTDSDSESCTTPCSYTICTTYATTACPSSRQGPSSSCTSWCSAASCAATASFWSWCCHQQRLSELRRNDG